jgi:hypothetical protein
MVLPVLRAGFADPGTLEAWRVWRCGIHVNISWNMVPGYKTFRCHVSYAYTYIYIHMYVSTCICTYKDIGFIYLYTVHAHVHAYTTVNQMHAHSCMCADASQLLSGFRLVLYGLLAYMWVIFSRFMMIFQHDGACGFEYCHANVLLIEI